MPLDSDVFRVPPGYNAPQQVHITQGDYVGTGVITSWITADKPGSNTLLSWAENCANKSQAEGMMTRYIYFNYTSGYIHHCTIVDLEYDTKCYYEVRIGNTTRQFWFFTPAAIGPDVPCTFGLIGDLGQTYDSNRTLTHYESDPAKGQTLLYVGTYPMRTTIPCTIMSDGIPGGETEPFKPYRHRFYVPYKASGSTSPFWYYIKRASAHIIVLASYSAFGKYTPQYKWLISELPKVNLTETPWLIVFMHSPMCNSYEAHYMEGETIRVMYECFLVKYKVDVVVAGHVHAYERSKRVSNIAYNIVNRLCRPISDESAPVYITVGDGGNLEGLAKVMMKPQLDCSALREASFGNGGLDIKNRTPAHFGWHRTKTVLLSRQTPYGCSIDTGAQSKKDPLL